MKKLYLVDVSSMYFRAFYAIRPLSNSQGMPTNALYGFLSMTVKLLKQIKPDYVAFCFDNKYPSFRKEIYQDYKANRSEMPEELVPQVPYVRKITDALGIAAFDEKGFEADDLIGTLTEFGREKGLEVVIVSGDKDFAQLVGPYVSMYDTMKEVRYDEQGVQDKWGIPSTQMIDYLALCGDASDNVPGVRGVGPKGAQKLLAEFNDIEEIYESIDKVKNKNVAKKLLESKDNAFLSKTLVTIKTDIPLVKQVEELQMRSVERDQLNDLLNELDFKSFAKTLLGRAVEGDSSETSPDVEETSAGKTEAASSIEKSEASVEQEWPALLPEEAVEVSQLDQIILPESDIWGLWTERGLLLSDEKKVFTVQGEPLVLGELLEAKKVKWQGSDLKKVWSALELKRPEASWDEVLAAYTVEAGAVGGFTELCQKYLGREPAELPSPNQTVQFHLQLKRVLQKRMAERQVESVFHEMELPLLPILYRMENRGILIDREELSDQSQELSQDIQRLEKQIQDEAGETFNVASTKQLAQVLFEKMEIPPVKKTKTGYSTDNEVLEKLAPDHAIAKYMIEYRELSKLRSTYVDALELLIRPQTGRLHTHFNQALTATGRLSSHDPNLQNIPIKTPRGSRVRRAFVSAENKTFLSVDYSQIELRVLAHITGDRGLCSAFENDQDIHAATAAQIYRIDLEDVTSEQRRNAKAVNFGIAYGQGPFGLAETLGISRKESTEIIANYFGQFPGVRSYMEQVVEQGKKDGFVQSIFGRRRYLPELQSKNGRIRKFGERAAINAPIQGAASDLVKKAMIEVAKAGIPGMLLQVHDELLFEVEDRDLDEVQHKVRSIMEDVAELKVPLKVNSAAGKNWEEAHA